MVKIESNGEVHAGDTISLGEQSSDSWPRKRGE